MSRGACVCEYLPTGVDGRLGPTLPFVNLIDPSRHPLLAKMAQGARWRGQDAFPGAPHAADAIEEWLRFIERHGRLDAYLPRLRDRAAQRDEAMAEVQAAYFLEKRCRLPVVGWEPIGSKGTGEFVVAVPETTATIAVEVKAPGWESEVTDNKRRKAPKYRQQIESLWVAPRERFRK